MFPNIWNRTVWRYNVTIDVIELHNPLLKISFCSQNFSLTIAIIGFVTRTTFVAINVCQRITWVFDRAKLIITFRFLTKNGSCCGILCKNELCMFEIRTGDSVPMSGHVWLGFGTISSRFRAFFAKLESIRGITWFWCRDTLGFLTRDDGDHGSVITVMVGRLYWAGGENGFFNTVWGARLLLALGAQTSYYWDHQTAEPLLRVREQQQRVG